MSFSGLGLSAPILKALHEQGYETPTAIQLQAIPAIMAIFKFMTTEISNNVTVMLFLLATLSVNIMWYWR